MKRGCLHRETSLSFTFGDAPFELSDRDALDTLADRILGRRRHDEMKRRTAALPAGVANDRIVDEVIRVLNRPLVRMALEISR